MILKRTFDIFFSVFSLLILSPIIFITFLIIKIKYGGPTIFKQKRIGLNGSSFIIFKFRSMIRGADKMENGTVTLLDDVRVTTFGKFIRKYKIDEIPTIFNILTGNMSFVGPRPTVMYDVEKMTKNQKKRHIVLPGLTGLAQIEGNTSLAWPERLEYDLKYIANMNFFFDLYIIIKTVILIFKRNIDTNPKGFNEWEI